MTRIYDFKDTTLVKANGPQTRFTQLGTFEKWGSPKGFDEEMFLKQDAVMSQEEWGVDDGSVTWVLVPRHDPTTKNEILSHCQTNRRNGLILQPAATTADNTTSYGIASVYTPPPRRGHKYSRHMLQLLHYVMAPLDVLPPWPTDEWGPIVEIEGFRNASFSVLYSAIGDEYYASCRQGLGDSSRIGWVRVNPPTRVWTVPSQSIDVDDDGWVWLDREGVKKVEPEAVRVVEENIANVGDPSKIRVAVLPDKGLLNLHAFRDMLSPGTISHGKPRTYGVRLPNDAFFTYCFKPQKDVDQCLEITFLKHPVPWKAAVRAAQREGCKMIFVWGNAGDAWANEDGLGDGLKFKQDSIPCIAVYGLGGEKNVDEVDWVFDERYVWC